MWYVTLTLTAKASSNFVHIWYVTFTATHPQPFCPHVICHPAGKPPPSKNLLHPNTSHVKEPLVPVWQWGIKCDRLIVEVEAVEVEEDAVAAVEVLPLLQLLLLSRLLSDHREWSTTSSPWPSHPLTLSFTHTQRQSRKKCLKPNIGGCFNLGNQVPKDARWWQLILDTATWCWGWF